MSSPKASLIIAFYNNTQALELIFKALAIQNEQDFEVVIADDGSRQEAVDFVLASQARYRFPIKHVWHEDKGFRKTRILNHAVLAASSDYLIFIDGDCIPQQHFIADHLNNAEPGKSLSGRRAELPERYTERIKNSESPGTFFEEHKFEILLRYLTSKGDNQSKGRHVEKGWRLGAKWQQYLLNLAKKPKSILGCNFSLYKDDLLKVNGFDMRYEAPCFGEDSDIDFRLNLAGVSNKSLKMLATQLHMYHPLLSRESPNKQIFSSVIEKGDAWTEFGVSSL
jgi:glycosyltransferase involved in cell wall biosynthesis